MKKLISTLLVLVLSLGLMATAFAAETPQEPAQLVVSGSSTISLQADMAAIELGAQTRGKTVGEAHKANITIMEAIIAALAEVGIAKEDIRTSSYYVYFEQDGMYTGETSGPISGNFNVTNMVQVTIRDIEQVSAAIDAASVAGANNVYSLIFQSTKSKEASNQALALAVEDARAKALVLAAATGRELGELEKVESTDSYAYPMEGVLPDKFATEGQASTTILAGNVSVSSNVVLTYRLK